MTRPVNGDDDDLLAIPDFLRRPETPAPTSEAPAGDESRAVPMPMPRSALPATDG